MRLPTPLVFVLLAGWAFCVSPLLADAAKPPGDAKDDARRLQGSWKVVALEAEGMKAPPDALKGMRWSFNGSELRMEDPASKGKAAVKLDLSKTPRHIDLVALDGREKGKTFQGIFKFDNGRLVVCLQGTEAAGKGRPRDFKTAPNSGLGMITLERVQE